MVNSSHPIELIYMSYTKFYRSISLDISSKFNLNLMHLGEKNLTYPEESHLHVIYSILLWEKRQIF